MTRAQANYQEPRSKLHYLKLSAAARRCPGALARPSGSGPAAPTSCASCSGPRSRPPRAGGSRGGFGRELPPPGARGIRLRGPTRARSPRVDELAPLASSRSGERSLHRPAQRRQDDADDRARPAGGPHRLPRLLHDRGRVRRAHRPRARLPADARRGRRTPLPGHLPPLRAGLDPHHHPGIADWGETFEDTTVAAAILDRLSHHATVVAVEGESCRMRRHRARLEQLRAGFGAGDRPSAPR